MEIDDLLQITQEVKNKVRGCLKLDETSLKESVERIKHWLELQPHLPKDKDDRELEHLLIICKNSIEESKKYIDLYYTMRKLAPEMMTGWNVNESWFHVVCKNYYIVPMPALNAELDRVIVTGYLENHDDLVFVDSIKLSVLVWEIRMVEDYNNRDIIVFDMKHVKMSDGLKIDLPFVQKTAICATTELKTRLKAIHFINMHPTLFSIINIVKSVLKPKFADRVYTHGTDLTEFHQHVHKDCLPNEYGGNAGDLMRHWELWQKKLTNSADWLIRRENVKSDESKRPTNNVKYNEMFGTEGSFRKICID
ncbi:hypothetical protein L9F63_022592 [Diploptera punctata]|uniref:CRAL-TRIO domain-containing protein n=1 Tax=Diploptera punctata TaxID=6984 RepID=A0AAD7ZLX6_DIPPU|nr:hypothetical protein L9F63_022592 [Diploptera punctata]